MLRGIARSYRLTPAAADDAVQNTWLCLLGAAAAIRRPEALAGWLATTARRECLRLLQSNVQELPTDDADLGDGSEPETPHDVLLAAERRAVVARAVATLPPRRRAVLTLLAAEEGYGVVGERLAMPVGSIGPTRARALEQLRFHPELRALCGAA
jgi:RNA polymerase sigma factor (sigma-70 family)